MLTPVTPPFYLTINQSDIVHELSTHPVTPLLHLAFKNASLKPIREFGFLEHELPGLLVWHLQ